MLEIHLLVEGNQRGIVQLAGNLIEHGADLRRQAGFAHQRHHILTRLFMFIILEDHPFLLRQVALGGGRTVRDVDFAPNLSASRVSGPPMSSDFTALNSRP